MKVCAIICEYNPLHAGHAYQLEKARAFSGADFVLCLMSGPFVQRGEPAIVDKWTRAQAALLAGADMVLELPSIFALRAAQDFAFGAASLLDALGIVTHLSFGSETDELNQLYSYAAPETDLQSVLVEEALSKGNNYPRALAIAKGSLPANALLGVEYLRALRKLESSIEPVVVRRESPHGGTGSSSDIRRLLLEGRPDALHACPQPSAFLTSEALRKQGGVASFHRLDALALHLLRSMDCQSLSAYPGMEEGLEHRLWACAQEASGIDSLLSMVKTKRYTMARLKRSLLHVLLDNTKGDLSAHPTAEYARVLGFRQNALPLLQQMGKKSRIPLVLRPAQWKEHPLFKKDLRAQDLWGLCQESPSFRKAGRDFDMPLIKL